MKKILFAGEGGQGVQAIAQILAKAAFREGQNSLYIPNFGVEQRGGTSLAFVIVDQKPVAYPKFRWADILVVMSDRSWPRVQNHWNKETRLVLGPAVKKKPSQQALKLKPRGLPSRVWNILALGQVNKIGKVVSHQSLLQAFDERFAHVFKKNPGLRALDLKALKNEKL